MKPHEQIAVLRESYIEESKEIILKAARELFAKYSRLKSFSLVGYTPYFSDGDPCYFYTQSDEPEINGYDEYEDYEGEEENLYEATDAEAEQIIDAIRSFLGFIDDQVWNDVFDDHFKLTFTEQGVKRENYDHD